MVEWYGLLTEGGWFESWNVQLYVVRTAVRARQRTITTTSTLWLHVRITVFPNNYWEIYRTSMILFRKVKCKKKLSSRSEYYIEIHSVFRNSCDWALHNTSQLIFRSRVSLDWRLNTFTTVWIMRGVSGLGKPPRKIPLGRHDSLGSCRHVVLILSLFSACSHPCLYYSRGVLHWSHSWLGF